MDLPSFVVPLLTVIEYGIKRGRYGLTTPMQNVQITFQTGKYYLLNYRE